MTADTFALALLATSSALNVVLLYLFLRSQRDMKKLRESYHRVIFEPEKMKLQAQDGLLEISQNLRKSQENVEKLLETLQSAGEVKK